jgi:hypothetical protein
MFLYNQHFFVFLNAVKFILYKFSVGERPVRPTPSKSTSVAD